MREQEDTLMEFVTKREGLIHYSTYIDDGISGKKLQSDEFTRLNGQIGVVLIDGEAFIKKMYVEGNKLRLVSLNRLYEDVIANGSNEISVYGRVVL